MLSNLIFPTVYHFRSNNVCVMFCGVTMFVDLRWYAVGNITLGSVSLEKQIRTTKFPIVYHFRSNNFSTPQKHFPTLHGYFHYNSRQYIVHTCLVLQCHNVCWSKIGKRRFVMQIRTISASLEMQVWKGKFGKASLEILEMQCECRNGVRSLENIVLWKIVAEIFIPQTIW